MPAYIIFNRVNFVQLVIRLDYSLKGNNAVSKKKSICIYVLNNLRISKIDCELLVPFINLVEYKIFQFWCVCV